MRLILVRHGETERNSEARLQGGKSDLPLNEKGRNQVRYLGLALKGEKLEAIYSSHLKRALETAQAISAHHRLGVQPDPALAEIDMGFIDGLDLAQVKESQADFLERWRQEDYSVALPGGESVLQVRQRAWGAVQGIINRHREGNVAIVGHGITLQTIITALLGAPLSSFTRFRLGVASITIFQIENERTSLVSLNETCHLNSITK
jgi:broad specificity phosphatase PhoE